MDNAIQVSRLGKCYTIRHEAQQPYLTLRDTLGSAVRRVMNRSVSGRRGVAPIQRKEEFWALRDINFDVVSGERLGIIGRNGAGKSTLLKLLSRITEPTCGSIKIKGRVASLLEVGTGFHPELTGRENIFLNGAILGMGRAEIREKFDEIVAFAEVQRFLDTPVKRYSSGMYVRLAFSVAAHLEPEILIVDEVLAVGDAQFQNKCMGKMERLGGAGRTVIFVSHNMGAIQQLTNRCIVLHAGRIIADEEPSQAVETYNNSQIPAGESQSRQFDTSYPGLRIANIKLEQDSESGGLNRDIRFKLNLELEANLIQYTVGFQIVNSIGARIGTAKVDIPYIEAGKREIAVVLRNHYLPPGKYSVNVGMDVRRQGVFYEPSLLRLDLSDQGIDDPFVTSRRDKLGVLFPTVYEVA